MQPLLGSDPHRIGPYRVIGRLGAGGMGVVYAAVDDSGRRVAVKVVHEALSVDLEFRRRFSREVSVLAGVEGACVAHVLAADPGTERPWLATEFVPGPTLEQHVRAEGPLAGDALYGLAAGLAEALVAMHAAGVVHRDLKPPNVILSPEGPRLIDFGIAKVLDETSMTHTGTLVGSPGWISPEEYGEGGAGTPADVYGWALLVLYATTGEPPYGTGRPEILAYRVREEMPDVEPVPEALSDLVRRALAKDPAARPTAGEALAEVTTTWQGAESEEERPDVTALIERTWVLPEKGTPEWPKPAVPPPPTTLLRVPEAREDPGTLPAPVEASVTAPAVIGAPGSGPNWVHAYIATAAAVTLIVVTAIIASSASGRERSTTVAEMAAPSPATSPSPSPATPVPATTFTVTPTPAVTPSAKKPKPKAKRVSFQGIALTLPKGWRMRQVRSDLACIDSPHSQGASGPWDFDCKPDALVLRTGASNSRWPGSSIDDPYYGWQVGSPMPCLRDGHVWRDWTGDYSLDYGPYAYHVLAYDGSRTGYSLTKMADGRKAAYREWQVWCSDYGAYSIKIWHLPQSKVSLFVLSARPEDAKGYRRIAASADLLGYAHAAPV
ncbi:serine/threonine-protein kinase [Microbispora sp. H10836]|uniref:serine/threonine protein kinase n=1 Tax=Microbispora sp. H10836 TaxID=2729106 RepID=UPI0014746C70|nr:serine/threonine-protein kinase [Microbispora sp. H10836]